MVKGDGPESDAQEVKKPIGKIHICDLYRCVKWAADAGWAQQHQFSCTGFKARTEKNDKKKDHGKRWE